MMLTVTDTFPWVPTVRVKASRPRTPRWPNPVLFGGFQFGVTTDQRMWIHCIKCGAGHPGPDLSDWPYRDVDFTVHWQHECLDGPVTFDNATFTYA